MSDKQKNLIFESSLIHRETTCQGFSVVEYFDEITNQLYSGLVDHKGNIVIPLKYCSVFFSGEHLLYICNRECRTHFRKYQESVLFHIERGIIFKANSIELFNEGRARFIKNEKFGFIDSNGYVVVKAKYEYATIYSNSLALISDKGKCGFVDFKGNIVIPMKFDSATPFIDDYSFVFEKRKVGNVVENHLVGKIDKRGQKVISKSNLVKDVIFSSEVQYKIRELNKLFFKAEKSLLRMNDIRADSRVTIRLLNEEDVVFMTLYSTLKSDIKENVNLFYDDQSSPLYQIEMCASFYSLISIIFNKYGIDHYLKNLIMNDRFFLKKYNLNDELNSVLRTKSVLINYYINRKDIPKLNKLEPENLYAKINGILNQL